MTISFINLGNSSFSNLTLLSISSFAASYRPRLLRLLYLNGILFRSCPHLLEPLCLLQDRLRLPDLPRQHPLTDNEIYFSLLISASRLPILAQTTSTSTYPLRRNL
jgi:hypothetical protein